MSALPHFASPAPCSHPAAVKPQVRHHLAQTPSVLQWVTMSGDARWSRNVADYQSYVGDSKNEPSPNLEVFARDAGDYLAMGQAAKDCYQRFQERQQAADEAEVGQSMKDDQASEHCFDARCPQASGNKVRLEPSAGPEIEEPCPGQCLVDNINESSERVQCAHRCAMAHQHQRCHSCLRHPHGAKVHELCGASGKQQMAAKPTGDNATGIKTVSAKAVSCQLRKRNLDTKALHRCVPMSPASTKDMEIISKRTSDSRSPCRDVPVVEPKVKRRRRMAEHQVCSAVDLMADSSQSDSP